MAVMMAQPAAAQATHQETRDLAQRIIVGQSREIAQMRGWAKDWYGTDVPDPIAVLTQLQQSGGGMSGMSGTPLGQLGGMAMLDEMSALNSLRKLSPARLEVVFLTMIVLHHQSAIDMSTLVSGRAVHQELKDLSASIIQGQSNEINTMNGWLGSWYEL